MKDTQEKGATMGRRSCISRLAGRIPQKLRSYNGDLFGWEFDTSAPVAETISQRANCRFVNRDTTDDWVGILGGAGGSPSYHSDAIFYIGFPTS